MNPKNQPKDLKKLSSLAKYSTMAFQMGIIIGLGVFGGIKLDRWLHMRFPLFTILLSLISVAISIYYFIKDLITLNRK
jgi:predicted MFS family arabinose efflux permease